MYLCLPKESAFICIAAITRILRQFASALTDDPIVERMASHDADGTGFNLSMSGPNQDGIRINVRRMELSLFHD
jgi:hypothetical protein